MLGWLSQLKHPTLGFSSGHDLIVRELESCFGFYADSAEPVWDSLSPSLSVPPPLMLSPLLALKLFFF